MNINHELELAYGLEKLLREHFIKTAERHKTESEIYYDCQELASVSEENLRLVDEFLEKYPQMRGGEVNDEISFMLKDHETGLSLLNDLHYLWLLTRELEFVLMLLFKAAEIIQDVELNSLCDELEKGCERQAAWLMNRISIAVEQYSMI